MRAEVLVIGGGATGAGIAMKVGDRLFKQIAANQPDLAVCDSETCRWQIEHATGLTTVHPLEILYRATLKGAERPTP